MTTNVLTSNFSQFLHLFKSKFFQIFSSLVHTHTFYSSCPATAAEGGYKSRLVHHDHFVLPAVPKCYGSDTSRCSPPQHREEGCSLHPWLRFVMMHRSFQAEYEHQLHHGISTAQSGSYLDPQAPQSPCGARLPHLALPSTPTQSLMRPLPPSFLHSGRNILEGNKKEPC